ncbi:uncharacterized protein FRV6_13262 [Fusarium oxysporum]|uniref:Uncharacterized protein n=1 Tax=Fusarium oxysporum TaxID=5507 RepID=A0A2H3TKG4_FUSOX|nr:uncharacterized protein FRV6_13262 [Fusarium oxysporum]
MPKPSETSVFTRTGNTAGHHEKVEKLASQWKGDRDYELSSAEGKRWLVGGLEGRNLTGRQESIMFRRTGVKTLDHW